MVWTTFNPVEAIPWVAGKIVVHGISYPVDDDYPVDNMSYPVGALLQMYPVDAIPWVTYTVDVSRGEHVISRGFIGLVISRGCVPWTICDVPWVKILCMHGVENMKISRGCQTMSCPVGA